MLEVVEENVNMMEDKDHNCYDLNMSSLIHSNKPILMLRGAHSRESSQGPLVIRGPNSNQSSKPKQVSSQSLNVVMQSQGPLIIKGPSSNQPSKPKQVQSKNVPSKLVVNPKSSYNLVDHLQRTPTQILTFELLELSPRHKQVLEDALHMENVPNNLDVDQF